MASREEIVGSSLGAASLRHKIAKYEEVKRRGVDFILGHENADGSFGPVEDGFFFYRLPWTFMVAGETRAALGICRWVRENMLTEEGDFDRGLRKLTDAYAYRNGTFIYGAHMARQYDLSVGCMGFLLTLRDPASGGFAKDMTPDGPSDDMDVPYTVGSGLACIATGDMDAALGVYGYLVSLWEQQDELPDRLYYNMSRRTQKVIREFPPEERLWHVVVAQDAVMQRWTVGGIASAFLCRLYMADPNPEYVGLARQYMGFSMESTDGPVCVRARVQVGVGLVAALPGDRRRPVPRLDGAHGRLVRRHAVRRRELGGQLPLRRQGVEPDPPGGRVRRPRRQHHRGAVVTLAAKPRQRCGRPSGPGPLGRGA